MKRWTLFFLGLIFFLTDRLLKILAIKKAVFFANPRLAFSLPLNYPRLIILLSSAIILIGLFLFFESLKKKQKMISVGLLLIILGAISNLADRIAYGFIIDYLHLWPISYFNLADLMIGAGIIIILCFLRSNRRPCSA